MDRLAALDLELGIVDRPRHDQRQRAYCTSYDQYMHSSAKKCSNIFIINTTLCTWCRSSSSKICYCRTLALFYLAPRLQFSALIFISIHYLIMHVLKGSDSNGVEWDRRELFGGLISQRRRGGGGATSKWEVAAWGKRCGLDVEG